MFLGEGGTFCVIVCEHHAMHVRIKRGAYQALNSRERERERERGREGERGREKRQLAGLSVHISQCCVLLQSGFLNAGGIMLWGVHSYPEVQR